MCFRIVTFFLSTLIGSTLLAGVIVAVPIVLHFYYLIPHHTERRQYVADNVSAWLYWTAANLLLSWYLAMIVDSIPIICNIIISLAWGEITESVRSRVELYNAAKGKIKPVLYGASGWVSWIIIFDGIYQLYNRRDQFKSRAPYTFRVCPSLGIKMRTKPLYIELSSNPISFFLHPCYFHRKDVGSYDCICFSSQGIQRSHRNPTERPESDRPSSQLSP